MTNADYKSYNEYFASNPEALEHRGYLGEAGKPLGTTAGEGRNWGSVGNPYRFRNEYNKFLGGLSPEYQQLGKSNINASALQSGAVKGILDQKAGRIVGVGPQSTSWNAGPGAAPSPMVTSGGTGSTHMLSPDVLAKMWR